MEITEKCCFLRVLCALRGLTVWLAANDRAQFLAQPLDDGLAHF